MSDLYNELGIQRDATPEQIKAAYRSLASKHHPDKNDGGNTEKFQQIQAAYDVLGDPVKRKAYDETGEYGKPLPPLDTKAVQSIAAYASQAMNQNKFRQMDYIPGMIRMINQNLDAAGHKMEELRHELPRLESLREMFEGDGLVAPIDEKINGVKNHLEQGQEAIDVANRALEILADYKYTGQETLSYSGPFYGEINRSFFHGCGND